MHIVLLTYCVLASLNHKSWIRLCENDTEKMPKSSYRLKPGFIAELTGRVDGPSTRLVKTRARQHGPC